MGSDTPLRAFWDNKRDRQDRIRQQEQVVIQPVGRRLQVISPYEPEFAREAKQMGGKWRRRSQVWSFPGYVRPLLLALIEKVYHTEPVWWRRKAKTSAPPAPSA